MGGCWGGGAGGLIGFRHESHDWSSLQSHLDTYLRHRQEWAVLDHDKPGMGAARTARTARFAPLHLGISDDGRSAAAALPEEAHGLLGAPARVEFTLTGLDGKRAEIRLVLRDKPANRLAEAGFLTLTPEGGGQWDLCKMGLWNRADNIVRGGGGQLQAVEAVRRAGLLVRPLDAALVGPANAPFMPFQPEVPDFSQGLRFNLYNNKWGTNFPMWWEGSVVFRFVVELE